MLKVSNVLLGAALLALAACQVHSMEPVSPEQVKAVRILEKPDVSTLDIYGHVDTCFEISKSAADPEQAARDALVAAALREFPDTGVLFMVKIDKSDTAHTYCASGIAARRKGT